MKRLAGFGLLVLGLAIYCNQQNVQCLTVLSEPLYAAVFYAVLGLAAVFLLTSRGPKLCVSPTGKAVLITGCDSGFGNSLALRLDKLGFKVFAGCLAPDRKGAKQLEEDSGGRIQVVEINVTDDQHVRCAVRFVKQNLGDNTLWACVNNAGIAVFQEIEWCSVIQFQQLMDVNVIGVVRVTKAFLPLIRASKGRVVNVASLAGRFTVPSFAAYSMSKKACIAFSDGLRQEMHKFDVKVITVEPGLYKTPIAATDYLIDTNRKSWAETPTEVKDVYGEEYFDAFLKSIEGQMKRARSNVEEVVDQMVEAVTTKEPRVRYVPNFMSNVRASILMYLPTSLTDRFFESIYKIKVDVKKAP